MEPINIIARTAVAFIILLILTRILGKKQMSQLTFFNYVTGITFGSIAAAFAVDRSIPAIDGVVSLVAWTALTALAGYIGLKSGRARLLIDGEPTIVIKKGKVLEEAMAAMRLNMDDLSMLLRKNNIFTFADVEYGIIEPNGQLSVLKKQELEYTTKKDINLQPQPHKFLPTEIISGGKLLERNLAELNLSREWLDYELNRANVTLDQVNYAEIKSDGTLYLDKKVDE
ncbi:MAG: membrane protein [Peptococcaceae bacterium BICA1-7]|nr:MAG: membrane protein [Peptococcaceae bacterium BICA1-7]HBV98385.1 DUF421 domain-containing protein [Desulfotomaculum sp.]